MQSLSNGLRCGALMLGGLVVASAWPGSAAANKKESQAWETTFSYHGYIKFDAITTRYADGDPGATNLIRDFYIPSLIPVGGESFTATDFHAKQTRFWLKTQSFFYEDEPITGHIELDFMVSPGGDERISNSYNPRVRHAFVKHRGLLIGQTWSAFMGLAALPEVLDFIGPTESVIFVRQPQIRFTLGGFVLSLENPETTITPNGGGARIVAGDSTVPDLVLKYETTFNKMNFSAAALVRELTINEQDGLDDSTIGIGGSISGRLPLGNDDIRFQINAGEGIGRYVGLNVVDGATVNDRNELEATPTLSGYIAYRRVWNAFWRSNLVLSAFAADNEDSLAGTGVSKNVQSLNANVIYQWRPDWSFGIEYARAQRELEDGQEGALDRVQFSSKFSF